MNHTEITPEQAGQRLDVVLTGQAPDLSRSRIQAAIKNGLATVNGLPVAPGYRVKPGDLIDWSADSARPADPADLADVPQPVIIADEADFLVVFKPAGLTVHGTATDRSANLADLIAARYPELAKVGDDPFRPGLVHRLDKEARGLLVIARTADAFDRLKRQFQERTVKKTYTALVHDALERESGEIDFPLARSRSGKIAARPKKGDLGEGERTAKTSFTIRRRLHHFTLLDVDILTGRTHQIRAHLAAIGHPIVGDALYGTAKTRIADKKIPINGIFLVADRLSFTGMDGIPRKYEIPLPVDLKNLLDTLK